MAKLIHEPDEIDDEEHEEVAERVAAIDVAKASGMVLPQIVGLRRGPERAHSSMGERGPQTRGPREIGDFVGWEMQGRRDGVHGRRRSVGNSELNI